MAMVKDFETLSRSDSEVKEQEQRDAALELEVSNLPGIILLVRDPVRVGTKFDNFAKVVGSGGLADKSDQGFSMSRPRGKPD